MLKPNPFPITTYIAQCRARREEPSQHLIRIILERRQKAWWIKNTAEGRAWFLEREEKARIKREEIKREEQERINALFAPISDMPIEKRRQALGFMAQCVLSTAKPL